MSFITFIICLICIIFNRKKGDTIDLIFSM